MSPVISRIARRYITAAATYTPITRDELEDWLNRLSLYKRWKRAENKAGIYLLPLSDSVAIKLSSTIGRKDDVMGRGKASMNLALVSLITGYVLNKKAMGQAYFTRTQNWRSNWLKGIKNMTVAYDKAHGFYDALAVIEDRAKYQKDVVEAIEAIPGWDQNRMLADFHKRVDGGGILTTKQMAAVVRAQSKKQKAPVVDDKLLARMRQLYSAVKRDNNQWMVEFVTSVGQQLKGGRQLSEKQQKTLDKAFKQYRIR